MFVGIMKGWAKVESWLGGGSDVGLDDGGNLSNDLGRVVGLTAAIPVPRLEMSKDMAAVYERRTLVVQDLQKLC